MTVAPGHGVTPPNRDLLTKTYLVGTIPVKPPPVEGEDQPVEGRPAGYPSESRRRSLVRRGTDRSADDAGSLPKAPLPPVAVPALPPITPLSGDVPLPGVLHVPARRLLPPVPALPEPSPAGAPPATTVARRPSGASGGRSRRRGTSCSGADRHRSHLCAARCVGEGPRGPAIGAPELPIVTAATTTSAVEGDIHEKAAWSTWTPPASERTARRHVQCLSCAEARRLRTPAGCQPPRRRRRRSPRCR